MKAQASFDGHGTSGEVCSPPGRCSQVSANQGARLLLSVVAVHCDPHT